MVLCVASLSSQSMLCVAITPHNRAELVCCRSPSFQCLRKTLLCVLQVVEHPDGTKRVQSSREATPGRLQNQIDAAVGGHRTSSALINGGGGVSSRGKVLKLRP